MLKLQKSINRKKLVLAIAVIVLAICSVTCMAIYSSLSRTLVSQQASKTFRGDNEERFSQTSAFFPALETLGMEDIYTFRQGLETKLLESSIESEDDQRLYIDAFSAADSVTIQGPSGTATASAIGVGGSFFHFHPLELLSGGYITEGDLMNDRIVIDKELAWRLFGGFELAGEVVYIDGSGYVIAGVVDRESDFASAEAYKDGAGLFMSYEALNSLTEAGINCYELVCISPISGFSTGIVSESFDSAAVVENSSRFSVGNILDVMGSFGERSMNTYGGVYPYWENAARLVESYTALALLFALVFGIPVILYAAVIAIIYWIKFYRKTKAKIPLLIDEHSEKRYNKRMSITSTKGQHLSQGEKDGQRNAKKYQKSI